MSRLQVNRPSTPLLTIGNLVWKVLLSNCMLTALSRLGLYNVAKAAVHEQSAQILTVPAFGAGRCWQVQSLDTFEFCNLKLALVTTALQDITS